MLDMETAEKNKVSPILLYWNKSWSFQKARKVTLKSYLLVFIISCSIAKAHSPNSSEAAALRFVETLNHQNQLHQI